MGVSYDASALELRVINLDLDFFKTAIFDARPTLANDYFPATSSAGLVACAGVIRLLTGVNGGIRAVACNRGRGRERATHGCARSKK